MVSYATIHVHVKVFTVTVLLIDANSRAHNIIKLSSQPPVSFVEAERKTHTSNQSKGNKAVRMSRIPKGWMTDLRERIRIGKCIAIVGGDFASQVSVGCDCHNADVMLLRMAEFYHSERLDFDKKTLLLVKGLIEKKMYTSVISAFHKFLSKQFGEFLLRNFQTRPPQTPSRHIEIAKALIQLNIPIFTTSIGLELEACISRSYRSVNICHQGSQYIVNQALCRKTNAIMHLYGTFDDANSIVFSEHGFNMEWWKTIVSNYTVLLIGCDRGMECLHPNMWKVLNNHYSLERYERDPLRHPETRRVIPYGQYGERTLLQWLLKISGTVIRFLSVCVVYAVSENL